MKDYSRYILNIKKSPYDWRDFKFRAIYAPVSLPSKSNNRQFMLPARDQGNQGTCAAFSASEAQQCRDTKEFGLKEYLSPQFIYNQREDLNEEGMTNRDLMKLIQDKGVCLEHLYRYGTFTEPTQEAYENALNHRSNNYAKIDFLSELKQALYIKGPCVMAIPVYNYTERMWYQRVGDEFLGGHDVCVVDYDDDERTLLILNSWGDDFGDEGYIEMSYDDFNLAWEFWSNVDLPSSPTTTEAPTTTPAPEPEPKKKPWLRRNLWWILVTATSITVILILLLRQR
jgi:C1A family cysteine protease